jgi:dTDP-4-dehydrorhamnose reductase
VTDRQQVLTVVSEEHPDLIINCAAFTQVDRCETEEVLANRVNGEAVGLLAEAAKSVDATLVHISTDYVFAGDQTHPYREDDPVAPQSAYGRSKLLGEQALLASGLEKYFIIRTSWLYGPGGNNFVETMIRLAKERDELRVVADQIGSPTYTGDLATAIFHLLKVPTPSPSRLPPHASRAPYGLYHFANEGECSWYDFAVEIVALARDHGEAIITQSIQPIATEAYPLPAKRPDYSVFCKEKYQRATGAKVPEWRQSLRKYFENRSAGF